jgi:hypothetical protein
MNVKPENEKQLSRRTALQAIVAVFAAGASGLAATDQKIAQNLVQYQGTPKDGHECDKCMHFIAPDSCKVVAGKVSPKGWCAAFAAKPA